MKKAISILAGLILVCSVSAQLELRQKELKGIELTKAADDYLIYGDVKKVTTAHYMDLFGEVSMGSETTLHFDRNGNKTREKIYYNTLGIESTFLILYYYDSQGRLTELNYVDPTNERMVDQKITFKYDDSGNMIEKSDTYDGKTKKSYYTYNELGDIETIKNYDYSGNLLNTVEYTCGILLGDIEKKVTRMADGSISSTSEFEVDALMNLIKKETTTNDYGTSSYEYIFDEYFFVIEKKTGYSSTYYDYKFDHKNWISVLEASSSSNMNNNMTGYYKRKIEYYDGKVTGDLSDAVPQASGYTSNTSNSGTNSPGNVTSSPQNNSNSNGCTYGNCNKGYGEWNDGKTYYDGFFKNGIYDGPGSISYSDGASAVAEYDNGIKNGFGIYNWNDTESYIGYFKNDQLDGYGIYMKGDETVVAIFDQGKYSQTFDFEFTNSSAGCIRGDCTDGFGIWKFMNGDTYTGYFKNSQMDMFGYYVFSNGESYLGEWTNGKKDGFGFYKWSENQSYLGYWKMNKMDGTGIYYYQENGENKEMSGTFTNGNHSSWDVK